MNQVIPFLGGVFTKPFFNDQLTKIIDKSADNQLDARIPVAYNKNCHVSLMTSFVKWGLGREMMMDVSMTGCLLI